MGDETSSRGRLPWGEAIGLALLGFKLAELAGRLGRLMRGRPLRAVWLALQAAGLLAVVAYVGALGWQEFGPRKPEVNSLRRELAEKFVPDVLADLRTQRTRAASVVLLHLAGDPTDHLSDRLRTALSESGVLNVREPTLDERVQRRLNLPVTSPATLDAAVARARGLGAPAVLFGSVSQFDGTPDGGRLTLELTLADIASKAVLFTRVYDYAWTPTRLENAVPALAGRKLSLATRLLGWALVVLLLPVFSIGFLRATARRASNQANLGVLTLYTGIAAALAALIVGLPAGLTAWIALLVLTGLALAYHVWILTVAVRLEER